MICYIDIDETICETPKPNPPSDRDYAKAEPYIGRIQKVNSLFDEGHRIIYWTARGTLTGIPHYTLTLKQLNEWKCKYHNLLIGKPYYDLLIDDRSMRPDEFDKL